MVSLKTPICNFNFRAQDFSLIGIDDQVYNLKKIIGNRGTLVMFICNHCPYVKAIQTRLSQDIKALQKLNIGVIAIMLILALFLIFIFSILKKVDTETDNTTRLILVGSASLILLQAMIHIGVNIRLFPTTGMTLPFLSYGGSSIISVSILSGIILNLTKRKV